MKGKGKQRKKKKSTHHGQTNKQKRTNKQKGNKGVVLFENHAGFSMIENFFLSFSLFPFFVVVLAQFCLRCRIDCWWDVVVRFCLLLDDGITWPWTQNLSDYEEWRFSLPTTKTKTNSCTQMTNNAMTMEQRKEKRRGAGVRKALDWFPGWTQNSNINDNNRNTQYNTLGSFLIKLVVCCCWPCVVGVFFCVCFCLHLLFCFSWSKDSSRPCLFLLGFFFVCSLPLGLLSYIGKRPQYRGWEEGQIRNRSDQRKEKKRFRPARQNANSNWDKNWKGEREAEETQ